MATTSQQALERLLDALREHFRLVKEGAEAESDQLVAAEDELQDAFFSYDNVLFAQFGAELPFDIYDEEDDEDLDDEEDDEDFEVYEFDDLDDDEDDDEDEEDDEDEDGATR